MFSGFFLNGKVIFNVACPSLYPAHDRRRDAFPPAVSERSHGWVHKLLLLLSPFNVKWRMTVFLCKTQTLSDTKVSFPSRKWHRPEELHRGACLHWLPSRYRQSADSVWTVTQAGTSCLKDITYHTLAAMKKLSVSSSSQDMVQRMLQDKTL